MLTTKAITQGATLTLTATSEKHHNKLEGKQTMLKIIGPMDLVHRSVPMHDGFGHVTAWMHLSYIDYVLVDGRENQEDSRLARAGVIAAETGGEVRTRRRKDNYLEVWVKQSFDPALLANKWKSAKNDAVPPRKEPGELVVGNVPA